MGGESVQMAIYSDERIEFFQRQSHGKDFRMAVAHYHDKHELYYLERGTTKYLIDNEIYLLEAGDMIFVPKGVFHQTVGNEESERLLFVFDDGFVGEEYSRYVDELRQNRHIRLSRDQMHRLRDIFSRIEAEDRLREEGYLEIERLYLREMLVLISRLRLAERQVHIGESYGVIGKAAKYIGANYNEDLTLSLLARRYAMSPGHFSKQFKHTIGVGLNEYINIARIAAARRLLCEQKLPITEVATRCGFNDSNYFAAVFKRIMGTTPKKYAKEHQG